MESSREYVHGTEPEEQRRLTTLNALVNEASLRELAPLRGERVLDVGAGLAQLARAVARQTGVPVVGIERSTDQIDEALRQARAAGEEHMLELRTGSAEQLPLAPSEVGTFDVAHARFLLEHVPRPDRVVAEMVRAVRPGGRVVLEDDDHDLLRLWPEPAHFSTVWGAYVRSYDRAGNDPYVGRRLVGLLHDAGARPRRNTLLFFGSCQGAPTFAGLVRNIVVIFEGARPAIEATGLGRDVISEAIEALGAWERRADAALWYAISWAEGVRPG